jgi:hypothetical protein
MPEFMSEKHSFSDPLRGGFWPAQERFDRYPGLAFKRDLGVNERVTFA